MEHNKRGILKITLILFLFSLILFGCQKKGPSQTITTVDIYQGSEGLAIDFLENAPPDELYEEDAFRLILKVDNKGASDVVNGLLSLSLEKDYMNLLDLDFIRQFKLKGKSIQIPMGDERIEEFAIRTKKIDPQSETHTSSIRVTACYDYSTLFFPSVCIDTDRYKENPIRKACEVKDISASDQGAPVAVTLVEEKILPKENNILIPTFIIHIANVGNGEIIDKHKIKEACSSGSFEHSSWNYIYVDAFLGDQQLKCMPEEKGNEESKTGYLKIKEKEGNVRCILEEGVSTRYASYMTTLKIHLTYGYTFTLSKDVPIKKIDYPVE